MRQMVLALTPDEIGLTPGAGRHVWGVVMDTAMADGGGHFLVTLADGTTSLYTRWLRCEPSLSTAGGPSSHRRASWVMVDMPHRPCFMRSTK